MQLFKKKKIKKFGSRSSSQNIQIFILKYLFGSRSGVTCTITIYRDPQNRAPELCGARLRPHLGNGQCMMMGAQIIMGPIRSTINKFSPSKMSAAQPYYSIHLDGCQTQRSMTIMLDSSLGWTVKWDPPHVQAPGKGARLRGAPIIIAWSFEYNALITLFPSCSSV